METRVPTSGPEVTPMTWPTKFATLPKKLPTKFIDFVGENLFLVGQVRNLVGKLITFVCDVIFFRGQSAIFWWARSFCGGQAHFLVGKALFGGQGRGQSQGDLDKNDFPTKK